MKHISQSVTKSARKVKARFQKDSGRTSSNGHRDDDEEEGRHLSSAYDCAWAQGSRPCGLSRRRIMPTEEEATGIDHEHGNAIVAEELQTRLNDLPVEILDIIRGAFFDLEFGPKQVQAPSKIPNVRLFLAMNKRLYAKYQNVFLSENTWHIESGTPGYSTAFLKQIPDVSASKVKKVTLRLSPQDHPAASVDGWLQCNRNRIEALEGDYSEVLHRFDMHIGRVKTSLDSIWDEKIDDIWHLGSSVHLTLDMGTHTAWMGRTVACS